MINIVFFFKVIKKVLKELIYYNRSGERGTDYIAKSLIEDKIIFLVFKRSRLGVVLDHGNVYTKFEHAFTFIIILIILRKVLSTHPSG